MRKAVNGRPIVRVTFITSRDHMNPPQFNTDLKRGYAYVWPKKYRPPIGAYALAGGKEVYVCGYGTNYKGKLKTIGRVLPGNARTDYRARKVNRLKNARKALTGERIKGVPPIKGTTANVEEADSNGSWWWRTWKIAEETEDPDMYEFRHVAQHWYKVRDAAKVNSARPRASRVEQEPSDASIRPRRAMIESEVELEPAAGGRPMAEPIGNAEELQSSFAIPASVLKVRADEQNWVDVPRRQISAWRVVLGIFTCGLSLIFTGVREKR